MKQYRNGHPSKSGFYCLVFSVLTAAFTSAFAENKPLVLVSNGEQPLPIVLAPATPPDTLKAANDLAEIIGKISGATPQLFEDLPDPMPAQAIWVGYQPELQRLFPDRDFKFSHPEEILLAANENHLVIAGRDRVIGNVQTEFGTANAVYTFLQEKLNVRWLWPGELGEVIPQLKTLALEPFEIRYHPQIRQREILRFSRLDMLRRGRAGKAADWSRKQRILLRSATLFAPHAFDKWWEKHHEEHPDYFALQPDGTRNFASKAQTVKICQSNPAVWEQWLKDVAESLAKNPSLLTFSASANDGHNSGICICENCRAWDPEGAPIWGKYYWRGVSQDYVAMTDRYIRFANTLAGKLKERYPELDLMVGLQAYGPSTPPPINIQPSDNVFITYVGFFPFAPVETCQKQKEQWRKWAEKAPLMVYRPNLWYWGGGVWGLPEVAFEKTIEDFRFLGKNSCIGLDIDLAREHWATIGPQYYLMAQLAWNPFQDGHAVLEDYFKQGFGPAAREIEKYWGMMEQAVETAMALPDFKMGGSQKKTILTCLNEVFDEAFLHEARLCLDRADAILKNSDQRLRQRVDFVRAGWEYTGLIHKATPLMDAVRSSKGGDKKSLAAVEKIWERIKEISEKYPYSINYLYLSHILKGGYMGGMNEFFGPPPQKYIDAPAEDYSKPAEPETTTSTAPPAIRQRSSATQWELVLEDDFDRKEIGANWAILEGEWVIENGELKTSGGSIVSARGYPGFQRLEFDVISDVKPFMLFTDRKEQPAPDASDLSSFIQTPMDDAPWRTGYFFQYGGLGNQVNQLRKAGSEIWADRKEQGIIKPDKLYRIVIENDEGLLRFTVNGESLSETREETSLVGEGFDRFGFYFYTAAKLKKVRLLIKPLDDGMI